VVCSNTDELIRHQPSLKQTVPDATLTFLNEFDCIGKVLKPQASRSRLPLNVLADSHPADVASVTLRALFSQLPNAISISSPEQTTPMPHITPAQYFTILDALATLCDQTSLFELSSDCSTKWSPAAMLRTKHQSMISYLTGEVIPALSRLIASMERLVCHEGSFGLQSIGSGRQLGGTPTSSCPFRSRPRCTDFVPLRELYSIPAAPNSLRAAPAAVWTWLSQIEDAPNGIYEIVFKNPANNMDHLLICKGRSRFKQSPIRRTWFKNAQIAYFK